MYEVEEGTPLEEKLDFSYRGYSGVTRRASMYFTLSLEI